MLILNESKWLKVLNYFLLRNKNTLFVGKVFLHFPTLPSTNLYAQELLSKSKPSEGTVISTFNQTAGRGQIGSSWISEPGSNLTLSVILYPSFLDIRRQFLLNQAVSLAVRDFVAKYVQKNVFVKWPNDIYVEGRKIAGILLQSALAGNRMESVVAGVGVNVNQVHFPDDIPNPTSLRLETGEELDLEELSGALCLFLEQRYLQLKKDDFPVLQQDYRSALFGFQQKRKFQYPDGRSFEGKIIGIAETGKLLIERENRVETFGLKEVIF